MNRRYYVIISIVLIAVVVVGLVYLYYNSNRPASTPRILYTSNISPQNTGEVSPVINASQDTTQQINLTLTSLYSPQIAIPIENLVLIAYNSTIDYTNNWDTSGWNTSLIQETVFNYSFSLSELTLQPNMSNSTIITLSLTDNAPLGRYSLEINLGKIKFLSANGEHDLSYSGSIWLGMIVTPKE